MVAIGRPSPSSLPSISMGDQFSIFVPGTVFSLALGGSVDARRAVFPVAFSVQIPFLLDDGAGLRIAERCGRAFHPVKGWMILTLEDFVTTVPSLFNDDPGLRIAA